VQLASVNNQRCAYAAVKFDALQITESPAQREQVGILGLVSRTLVAKGDWRHSPAKKLLAPPGCSHY